MAVSDAIERGESKLRRRLAFAFQKEQRLAGIGLELKKWQVKGWGPILFGGFLRDLMVFGLRKLPRDIDIVLSAQTTEQLERDLIYSNPRRNRFGGIHCELQRWNCDVWPLEATWGFHRNERIEPTPANLTRTTFLNVEAVAVEFGTDGNITLVHEHGFFNGIYSRVLDINLEENPFPSLAAVRSLLTAHKLDFAIAPRLSEFIVRTAETHGLKSFVECQMSHYGEVRLSESAIRAILGELESSISTRREVRLGGGSPRQLQLWNEKGVSVGSRRL